jgi:hypothetical protein
VKEGDILFGAASIECLECDPHYYSVYIKDGFGGWWTELRSMPSPWQLSEAIPAIAMDPEKLLNSIPASARTKIENIAPVPRLFQQPTPTK